jgi:hypothetical protein
MSEPEHPPAPDPDAGYRDFVRWLEETGLTAEEAAAAYAAPDAPLPKDRVRQIARYMTRREDPAP